MLECKQTTQTIVLNIENCVIIVVLFQKISILLPQTGNPSFVSYILSKILAFETLHPLGISSDPPRGRYGYFLEFHIILEYYTCIYTSKTARLIYFLKKIDFARHQHDRNR